MAHELDNLNIERRRLTQLVVDAAASQIDPAEPLVFAIGEEFSLGVVGLAASRLVEHTGLPAFVGTSVNGMVRGSARAPADVPLSDILGTQAELLDAWGGHARAAGFSVRPERVDELRAGLARELVRAGVQAPAQPRLDADCRVYPRTVTWETYEMTRTIGGRLARRMANRGSWWRILLSTGPASSARRTWRCALRSWAPTSRASGSGRRICARRSRPVDAATPRFV